MSGYRGNTPSPLDAVAQIAITLYGSGQMQISGNIGDVKLALQMLDHARDAVNNQWKRRDEEGLLLPPRNVEVTPHAGFPLTPNGDVAPELRMQDKSRGIRG